MRDAIVESFKETDKRVRHLSCPLSLVLRSDHASVSQLLAKAAETREEDGSCAVVSVLASSTMWIAHLGDCKVSL